MRGAKGEHDEPPEGSGPAPDTPARDESLALLREIRDHLRRLVERETKT
jgi:hypothetical protein